MPSPFPGMDPYLENPELWPDVHHGLIEALRDSLAPRLRPKYRVAIEKRTYLTEPEGLVFVGRPDVNVLKEGPPEARAPRVAESLPSTLQPLTVTLPVPDVVQEAFLVVKDVVRGEVVTALEVLSPANKRPGEGRRLYEIKRQRVLGSSANLVEVDLLRGGEPMPILEDGYQDAYGVLISRSTERPRGRLYRFGVRDPIPPFPLPLKPGDAEPPVDLQGLLGGLYDRAGYDLAVDYTGDPLPPLEAEDASWADSVLRSKGLR